MPFLTSHAHIVTYSWS